MFGNLLQALPTSLLLPECYSENPSYKRRLSCVPHREEEGKNQTLPSLRKLLSCVEYSPRLSLHFKKLLACFYNQS